MSSYGFWPFFRGLIETSFNMLTKIYRLTFAMLRTAVFLLAPGVLPSRVLPPSSTRSPCGPRPAPFTKSLLRLALRGLGRSLELPADERPLRHQRDRTLPHVGSQYFEV